MASSNGPGYSGQYPRSCCRSAGDPGLGGRSREVAARDGPRAGCKPGAASSSTLCRYAAIGSVWFTRGDYDRVTNSRRCHTWRYCRGNDGSSLGIQPLMSEEMVGSTPLHTFRSAWAICHGQKSTILQMRDRPSAHTLWAFIECLRCYGRLLRGVGGTPKLFSATGFVPYRTSSRQSGCLFSHLDLLRVRRLECYVYYVWV
jgi:hypothetical protein